MVDAEKRRVFVLNTVAGLIWQGIERGDDADAIVAQLVKRFKVERDVAARDVAKFFDDVRTQGLAE